MGILLSQAEYLQNKSLKIVYDTEIEWSSCGQVIEPV